MKQAVNVQFAKPERATSSQTSPTHLRAAETRRTPTKSKKNVIMSQMQRVTRLDGAGINVQRFVKQSTRSLRHRRGVVKPQKLSDEHLPSIHPRFKVEQTNASKLLEPAPPAKRRDVYLRRLKEYAKSLKEPSSIYDDPNLFLLTGAIQPTLAARKTVKFEDIKAVEDDPIGFSTQLTGSTLHSASSTSPDSVPATTRLLVAGKGSHRNPSDWMKIDRNQVRSTSPHSTPPRATPASPTWPGASGRTESDSDDSSEGYEIHNNAFVAVEGSPLRSNPRRSAARRVSSCPSTKFNRTGERPNFNDEMALGTLTRRALMYGSSSDSDSDQSNDSTSSSEGSGAQLQVHTPPRGVRLNPHPRFTSRYRHRQAVKAVEGQATAPHGRTTLTKPPAPSVSLKASEVRGGGRGLRGWGRGRGGSESDDTLTDSSDALTVSSAGSNVLRRTLGRASPGQAVAPSDECEGEGNDNTLTDERGWGAATIHAAGRALLAQAASFQTSSAMSDPAYLEGIMACVIAEARAAPQAFRNFPQALGRRLRQRAVGVREKMPPVAPTAPHTPPAKPSRPQRRPQPAPAAGQGEGEGPAPTGVVTFNTPTRRPRGSNCYRSNCRYSRSRGKRSVRQGEQGVRVTASEGFSHPPALFADSIRGGLVFAGVEDEGHVRVLQRRDGSPPPQPLDVAGSEPMLPERKPVGIFQPAGWEDIVSAMGSAALRILGQRGQSLPLPSQEAQQTDVPLPSPGVHNPNDLLSPLPQHVNEKAEKLPESPPFSASPGVRASHRFGGLTPLPAAPGGLEEGEEVRETCVQGEGYQSPPQPSQRVGAGPSTPPSAATRPTMRQPNFNASPHAQQCTRGGRFSPRTPARSPVRTPAPTPPAARHSTAASPPSKGKGIVENRTPVPFSSSQHLLFKTLEAARKNDAVCVESALQVGVDVDARDEEGNTLLMIASLAGAEDVVQLCVRNGADLSATNINGNTCLHLACREGHHTLSEYLRVMGADDSVVNEYGQTCYGAVSD